MLFAGPVMAQEQEDRLMQRLLNPQTDRSAPMGTKAFVSMPFASRAFEGGERYSGVKEVSRSQEFGTRSFLGIRNPWFGRKVFETEAARDLTKYVLSNKAFASSSVESVAAPEARRAMPVSRSETVVRDYEVRGRSQQAISAQHTGGSPLSLDDVRELLNRNR
jgi:hypothetical protein